MGLKYYKHFKWVSVVTLLLVCLLSIPRSAAADFDTGDASTDSVNLITQHTATFHGTSNTGPWGIYGFRYSLSNALNEEGTEFAGDYNVDYTEIYTFTSVGPSEAFSMQATGLTCATTYYYHSFVSNGDPHLNGSINSFTTNTCNDGDYELYWVYDPDIGNTPSPFTQESAFGSAAREIGTASAFGQSTEHLEHLSHSDGIWHVDTSLGGPEVDLSDLAHTFTTGDVYTIVFTDSGITDHYYGAPATPIGITTSAASSVGTSSARFNGEITDTGGSGITARGFQYDLDGTYNAPITVQETSGPYGAETYYLYNTDPLSCNTTYHYRSFGTNAVETAYGSDQIFTTNPCEHTFVSRLQFDGTQNYISAPYNAHFFPDVPFSIQVNLSLPPSPDDNTFYRVLGNESAGGGIGLNIYKHVVRWSVIFDGLGEVAFENRTIPVDDGIMHAITLTWDGSTLRQFIDGVADGEAPAGSVFVPDNGHDFFLGQDGIGTEWFPGKIEFFDFKLSGVSMTTYLFDEGTGTIVADSSGYGDGNHAGLYGSPLPVWDSGSVDPPGTPNMTDATDSGTSNSDNITSDTTPDFEVSCEVGATVTLRDDTEDATIGTGLCDETATIVITSSGLSAGVHLISAYQTDELDNISDSSDQLSVTIDSSAPSTPGTPNMTAGTDSGTSSTDNITSDTTPDFTISCESGATVTLKEGGTSLGTGTCSSSTVTITSSSLSQAIHTIKATQTDVAGNISADSSTLSVTIDATAPSAPGTPDMTTGTDSGTSNSDNITSDTTPDFTISCETGAAVTLKEGGTSLGTGTCSSSTVTITSSALSQAVHTIKALQTDPAGNVSADSSTLSVTIDATAPTTSGTPDLTSGTDSGTSSTDNITSDTTPDLTGSCTTGNTVTLYSDASSVGTATCSGSVFTITSSALSSGVHSITFKETDTAGNQSGASSALSITIDTAAPSVSVTAPSNLATISGSSVSVTATASDVVGVYGVQFKRETNTLIGSEDTGSPYGINLDSTALSDGSHTIIAVARDAAGNYATSTVITVTVDNIVGPVVPPSITTETATSPQRTSVTLNANITDTGGEDVTERGFVYGTDTTYGATSTDSGIFTTGTFDDIISSLTCNTTYHFNSYASNDTAGIAYGSDDTFKTRTCGTSSSGSSSSGSRINNIISTIVSPIVDIFTPNNNESTYVAPDYTGGIDTSGQDNGTGNDNGVLENIPDTNGVGGGNNTGSTGTTGNGNNNGGNTGNTLGNNNTDDTQTPSIETPSIASIFAQQLVATTVGGFLAIGEGIVAFFIGIAHWLGSFF